MKTSDWEKLEVIFQVAIDLKEDERNRYVTDACNGDKQTISEINSLLSAYDEAESLLADSALELGLQVLDAESGKLKSGQTIGHYRIERLLGEGGMGDVYLAEDTRLKRKVALKFLTTPSLDDNRSKRQMFKEARAAAMLDHPNICPVYAVEEIGDYRIIVMQYLEGDTLSHLIRSGEIKTDQVLPLARQMVDAIAAAHSHGILHRDIKPGNIMLTRDGQVKILDFGLAKIIQQNNQLGREENNLSRASQKGLIEGTVAYMSPEQLKAETLDYRSDIFSLGTVLFETATGVQPFSRDSDAETISAILSTECPLDGASGTKVPVELRPVIRKCLRTEREQRYQSASDLLLDLQSPSRPHRLLPYYLPITVAFSLIVLITAGLLIYWNTQTSYRTAVLPFVNETSDPGVDYLADGITEGLIAKLSGSDRLFMKPFAMVSGYRGSQVDHMMAGREVQADLVLTGRVSRQNDQLIVKTSLLDTRRGITLRSWEDSFEATDPLSFENKITERLASLLSIDPADLAESKRRGSTTDNSEAFRQYLVGRYYWRKRDRENLQLAIAAFQRAIDLDPGFSRPYSGLAASYSLLSLVPYGSEATKDTMTKAKAAARQALEIDALDAEAHTSLGIVLTKYDWNWQMAEQEFRRSIEIDPNYAAAHYWLSDVLAITGSAEESIREAELAQELDPFSQQAKMNVARTYYFARQYDQALEVLAKAGQNEKVDKKIRYMTGLIYLQKGMYEDALRIFQEISADNKLFAAAVLGYTYARLGLRKEAFQVIDELKRTAIGDHIPYEEIAFIHIALDERDRAFYYLNEAYRDRHAVLIALKVEPLFDPIRDDKRFDELLQHMSLN
jgi:serine/threonine-protein kinase